MCFSARIRDICCLKSAIDHVNFLGLVTHLRAIRPWQVWVLVCFGPHGADPFEGLTPQSPELTDCARELIGDERSCA